MAHSFHLVGSRGNILHCDPLYFLAGPLNLQRNRFRLLAAFLLQGMNPYRGEQKPGGFTVLGEQSQGERDISLSCSPRQGFAPESSGLFGGTLSSVGILLAPHEH